MLSPWRRTNQLHTMSQGFRQRTGWKAVNIGESCYHRHLRGAETSPSIAGRIEIWLMRRVVQSLNSSNCRRRDQNCSFSRIRKSKSPGGRERWAIRAVWGPGAGRSSWHQEGEEQNSSVHCEVILLTENTCLEGYVLYVSGLPKEIVPFKLFAWSGGRHSFRERN